MSCDSLVLLGPCVTRPMCIGSRCDQICSAALRLSHTGYWKFQHGTTWQRSLRMLKDILLRYMKMAKATRRFPTPWNWAAAQWLRLSSVLKVQVPLRTGLEWFAQRSRAHVLSVTSKCFLWKIGVGVLSALLQRLKRFGIRPYAALYIKLVCMAITTGGSLFWRWYTRKPPNSLLKTCQQSTWITGTMS